MLVLTRKTNESIIINNNIEVMVIDVRGDAVKIGIKAPRSISVNRKEIYEEILAANLDAAKSSLDSLKKLQVARKTPQKS